MTSNDVLNSTYGYLPTYDETYVIQYYKSVKSPSEFCEDERMDLKGVYGERNSHKRFKRNVIRPSNRLDMVGLQYLSFNNFI